MSWLAGAVDRARKRAAEAVAAEREKFNNILNVLPPYVVLLTPDYHVAFANREFKQRFGEDKGRRCFEFLFNRSEPCEICETYKVLQVKKPLDWKWTGPDGGHYDIYDFPFTDTDGSTLILEMGIDVTERKRTEAELHETQERFRLLLDGVKDYAIYMLDPKGRVVSWNAGAAHIKGYQSEEILGENFSCFYTAEDIASGKPARELQASLCKGRFEEENWRVRKDGSAFWASIVITPMYDDSGALRGFSKVARDVTERKRADEAVRKASRYARNLLEASLDPLVTISREGKITDVNEATEKVTGVSRERLIGSDFCDYFTDPGSARRGYKQVFAQGAVQDYPWRFATFRAA